MSTHARLLKTRKFIIHILHSSTFHNEDRSGNGNKRPIASEDKSRLRNNAVWSGRILPTF